MIVSFKLCKSSEFCAKCNCQYCIGTVLNSVRYTPLFSGVLVSCLWGILFQHEHCALVILCLSLITLCLSLSFFLSVGSLLETPYPFSPGTSPEPTSPVMPMVSPETPYPISQVALSQSDVKVESSTPNTGSIALGQTTTGPLDSATLTMTSDGRSPSPPGPTCITEATDSTSKNIHSTTEHFTSSTESVFDYGLKCTREFSRSNAGHITSTAETFTVTACTTRLNTSVACTPMSAATGTLTFTTGSTNTGTESTSSIGPITSKGEQITSTPVPTFFSVSTCATGPVPSPDLLESLEQLAQRGDDTHLPQYLHQVTCLSYIWHMYWDSA